METFILKGEQGIRSGTTQFSEGIPTNPDE